MMERLSEIVRAGEAAALERQYLALVLDSVAVVLVHADSQKILYASKRAEEMLGYMFRGELEGQPLETLLPADVIGLHASHVTKYLAEPTLRPMGQGRQLRARKQDGSTINVHIGLDGLGVIGGQRVVCVTLLQMHAQGVVGG